MSTRGIGYVAILLLGSLAMSALGEPAVAAESFEKVILNGATIVVDPDEPSYVRFAADELTAYLKESTSGNVATEGSSPARIVVGAKMVGEVDPQALPEAKLGLEGYRLKCVIRDGVAQVFVTGREPRGTKAALAALMKAVRIDGRAAVVPASLDVQGKPAFARRGMHLNGWPLNYPYSFRNWREEDWQRYVDLLSCQGVNLFYLWPFMEIMPVPLSSEDRAYLEESRRLVEYAQKKHGMEVWIMQCTNRVARDRCGVADPRLRPYWRPSQVDLNPGKPEDLRAILESRETMYRILDNVDGVCNIDSDPGFFPGSPMSDYVKVLQECRTLLDRYNLHGKQAKLVHWMLWGWGRAEKIQREGLAEHELAELRAVKQGLSERFWLISGQFPEYLPMCRDEGLISRTIHLPYGAIEGEPAYPQTQVRIDPIRAMFDGPDAQMPELAGIMGNVQTPLLQFPNWFFFTSVMSDFDYRKRSESEVLLDLAECLYPEHKELIADSFSALKASDPGRIESLAGRLEDVLRKGGLKRLGVLGRKLFPDPGIVATSLCLQLRLRAAHQRLMGGTATAATKEECARLLGDYFDAYIAWDLAHGWHKLWGWDTWPLPDLPVATLAENLRKSLHNGEDVDACLDAVARRLSGKHDAAIVQGGCITPLRSALGR